MGNLVQQEPICAWVRKTKCLSDMALCLSLLQDYKEAAMFFQLGPSSCELSWKKPPMGVYKINVLGLVTLNPIVWCYVWYYVWLNVVINKVVLLLSKIMVTWIFGYYHIVHEMHSMWFSHRRYKSQVLCKLRILVCSRVMKLGISSVKTITYQLRWFVLIMEGETSS